MCNQNLEERIDFLEKEINWIKEKISPIEIEMQPQSYDVHATLVNLCK